MTSLEQKYTNSIELLKRTFEILKKYVDANHKLEKEFTEIKNELIRLKFIGIMGPTVEDIEKAKNKFKNLIQIEEPLEKLLAWRTNQNGEIKVERIDPVLERYIKKYGFLFIGFFPV